MKYDLRPLLEDSAMDLENLPFWTLKTPSMLATLNLFTFVCNMCMYYIIIPFVSKFTKKTILHRNLFFEIQLFSAVSKPKTISELKSTD